MIELPIDKVLDLLSFKWKLVLGEGLL